jgi:hypothetical protein
MAVSVLQVSCVQTHWAKGLEENLEKNCMDLEKFAIIAAILLPVVFLEAQNQDREKALGLLEIPPELMLVCEFRGRGIG